MHTGASRNEPPEESIACPVCLLSERALPPVAHSLAFPFYFNRMRARPGSFSGATGREANILRAPVQLEFRLIFLVDGARPVLQRIARRVVHVGALGTGITMKLVLNLPLACYWQLLGEAG